MQNIAKKFTTINSNMITLTALMAAAAVVLGVFFTLPAGAEGTMVVVKGDDAKGWYSGDTTDGGAVTFFGDNTSPYPTGVLALTTSTTAGAKAQYLKDVDVLLKDVTDLSYYTKHVSGPADAAVSFQLNIALKGLDYWITSLVFDPSANGQVVAGEWQKWDVDSGRLWSSGTVGPVVTIGAGGAPYYTLDYLKAYYPSARVMSIGVYAGTFDPAYDVGETKQNYNVEADGVTFNGTTYDFEAAPSIAATKDQCKDGGWMSFQGAYTNQGQCVSSIVSNQ